MGESKTTNIILREIKFLDNTIDMHTDTGVHYILFKSLRDQRQIILYTVANNTRTKKKVKTLRYYKQNNILVLTIGLQENTLHFEGPVRDFLMELLIHFATLLENGQYPGQSSGETLRL